MITTLVDSLVAPPGCCIVLLLLGMLRRDGWLRRSLLLLGLGILYFASIPKTIAWLSPYIEPYPPVDLSHHAAEAIVVMTADRYPEAPEYGGDTLHGAGLARLRYAAWLQKRTGLPILITGGSVKGEPIPEAALGAATLREQFGAEVRWVEGDSRNSEQAGPPSALQLRGAGIGEILLVTHAWHMRRAVYVFERAGMKVVPAPTEFMRPILQPDDPAWWLPNASSLRNISYVVHETLGLLWYRRDEWSGGLLQ